MGSRWNAAWLFLLALKAFGLKEGDLKASMSLSCFYQIVPPAAMHCSWLTPEPPNVNVTYHLCYESLKYRRGPARRAEVPNKQNWFDIGRRNLTHGDKYKVWLEAHSVAGTTTSNELVFNLVEIVKPPPPVLHRVKVNSFKAEVRWENPHWSELRSHQPLLCALQYRIANDHEWTYVSEDHVNQESHGLDDLKPFTWYEVQVQCILKNLKGFWSDWSSSQFFQSLEAAPLGQVDVWRKMGASENREPSLLLLWKPLDQEAARGNISVYEVAFWDRRKNGVTTMQCICCNATLPRTASYAWVSARNSVDQTLPANLSLEQTDLPGPQDVEVLVAQGLGFNVTWKPSTSSPHAQPKEYVVEWREESLGEGESHLAEVLNWTRRPSGSNSALLIGNFRPKIPYLVHVYALYAQGSNASVPVRAYFQEAAPSAGPQALQERSISPTTSLISWKEIPLAKRNGHVTNYTLYLKNPTSCSPRTIGATERSFTLSDLEPGTSYQLSMTGSTKAGEGVPSHHHFRTPAPADSRWQVTLAIILVVGCLVILAFVVVFVKWKWFLSFYHKVLPPWCWEKIPDPGHSIVVLKIDEQGPAHATDALSPAKSLEKLDIVEIKESVPQQTPTPTPAPLPAPPPAPTPMKISGYEKRFMPTLEELQGLV
ncbi:interleukin-27 receptor subunit alpha isoform X2 [Hemicordylus capensis]|nr:interleukin-27 receptor subunit alpha isoform X2 [Hemicordylus capensis]XP_053155725.1 interleukin-27 receptor subunit alpha isoform X2 [Hemicordylus capensis]